MLAFKMIPSDPPKAISLSIVIPIYNEAEVMPVLQQRLITVLDRMPERVEIVFVDDGSNDNSLVLAHQFDGGTSDVTVVSLSRNFGKEAATSAGLQHAKGLAVILLDADLQDPPELIPAMVSAWRKGFDIVNMQRRQRLGESWIKRTSAACFYRLLNIMSDHAIPENVGDFRLLSREVVDHINELPERNRYMKGLLNWPGFEQTTLPFDREPRAAGDTKWNYFKLVGLAIDGITSFSIKPLRLATVVGSLCAGWALTFGAWIMIKTVLWGEPMQGYPTIMIAILALGGLQLLAIGILGEYLGRVFVEVKGRPTYLVKQLEQRKASQLVEQNQ
ncbi:glycosyltransferase family 2 protein [Ferrimonas lipolytica]|uniref:Glycosyltransferase family 2 protein n=1 Tax=Ferrimonas lipolytica TaxID=2724191 RepID=A0A6H1UBK9_9GAMM|nr:glycosyltransferase family 2 protein [Ferrimonas lipolytica]QIZ75970.1 glycosyltransferase family 2 protein [Ferrimonas lipolytica]